eukprot:COSAG05_NODE_1853_length_3957_cov_1.878434_4_plen_38_part_00
MHGLKWPINSTRIVPRKLPAVVRRLAAHATSTRVGRL